MKFLNLAISAAIGLAATVASAQMPVPVAYDTFSTATGVTYYTGPGNNLSGDVMRLTPSPAAPWNPTDTFDTICILFVATAPGTYNIDLTFFNNFLFGTNLPGNCLPTIPVTIPAGGTFPSVWRVCFCFGPTPLGNADQAVVVSTNSASFSTAYVNNAATPAGTDVPFNGFFVNFATPLDCQLTPAEFVTFGNPGAWNLAVQLTTTGCIPPPQFTCNGPSSSVAVTEMPHLKATPLATLSPSIRVNTKL